MNKMKGLAHLGILSEKKHNNVLLIHCPTAVPLPRWGRQNVKLILLSISANIVWI